MTHSSGSQTTLARSVTLQGVGLHTGTNSTLTFHPAEANAGYTIIRTDLPGHPIIHPTAEAVSQTQRGTTLRENGVEIHTVEHVLAALSGLRIDNCRIDISANEPPIMDGSARPFVEALLAAGIVELPDTQRLTYALPQVFQLDAGDKSIVAWPHASLKITFILQFEKSWLPTQRVTVEVTPESFQTLIAHSRTFCFEHEIEWLKSKGLAQGGNLENAIVIGTQDYLNGPLRSECELVYHKILDFIGDLALVGRPVEGEFIVYKSGHALNTQMAQQLRQNIQRADHFQRGNASTMIIQASEIQQYLPHRYPFLLVDRIIDMEAGKRVVGIKNVTINEPFFQGHFPGHPIMPGVLIVEAMAQVGGVLLLKAVPDAKDKVVYFVSIDGVKFRKPVIPGDQLRFVLEVIKLKGKIAKMKGQAFVGEDLVCEAELMSTIMDK